MKFLAIIFATLAILPQAIKGFASWFYGFNKCAVGAPKCMVSGQDQGHLLGILYNPNFFNTTGLWIGIGGTVLALAGMYVQKLINDRQTDEVIDKAEAHRAPGRRGGGGGGQRTRGAMPRPGYMDGGRARRPAGGRDDYDGRGRDRYNDRYDDEYDPDARFEGRSRRRRDDDDDDYDDRPRGGGRRR